MKYLLFCIIFSAVSVSFAQDKSDETIDLIPPIAVEREDGLDKLPSQVFTDSTGVETWFVEERGFQAGNIAEKAPTPKVNRSPAAKKLAPGKTKKLQDPKRKPASKKKVPVKKKTGRKK